jgi:hypothetical protein
MMAEVKSAPRPSLLVWGRIIDGQPVLEPAFQMMARPSLPVRAGPYSLSATALDGSRLFTLSFDMAKLEDGSPGNGHFAFAVPLDRAGAAGLSSLRLTGPSGTVTRSSARPLVRSSSASDAIAARRDGQNVSLRWDAARYPMIMVRDPDSGEVLAFGRGGTATVRTSHGELDLVVSDGVRSQRLRLAINRS